MAERSTTVESVSLTAICTGGVLALVGTTLYWARVTDLNGTFYLVRLTDIDRVAAPVAVIWVVLAAGAALAGRGPSPWARVARLGTLPVATTGAFFLLGETVFAADGNTVLAHAAVTDNPSLVSVARILPDAGCLLYVVGLMLVAVGAGIVEVASRGLDPAPPPPGGRPLVHRIVLVSALVLGVVAAVLPWYRGSASDVLVPGTASPPGNADAQAWLDFYRAGLAACLAITVLALLLRRQAPRLRLLGLVVGVAVTVMLLSGYVSFWREPTLRYTTDRIGFGYHLGLVAMILLTASFAALPPSEPEPDKPEPEPEPEPEEDRPEEGVPEEDEAGAEERP